MFSNTEVSIIKNRSLSHFLLSGLLSAIGLRRREIEAICKIGAPRRQVTAILGMEILIVLGVGSMIALALTLVAR